eukprot:3108248-Pyramimonas_sp.AAC.1
MVDVPLACHEDDAFPPPPPPPCAATGGPGEGDGGADGARHRAPPEHGAQRGHHRGDGPRGGGRDGHPHRAPGQALQGGRPQLLQDPRGSADATDVDTTTTGTHRSRCSQLSLSLSRRGGALVVLYKRH